MPALATSDVESPGAAERVPEVTGPRLTRPRPAEAGAASATQEARSERRPSPPSLRWAVRASGRPSRSSPKDSAGRLCLAAPVSVPPSSCDTGLTGVAGAALHVTDLRQKPENRVALETYR